MNKYAVAYFSLMNGELIHKLVIGESVYDVAITVLTCGVPPEEQLPLRNSYPTYESLQEEYLPAVEDWLSVIQIS